MNTTPQHNAMLRDICERLWTRRTWIHQHLRTALLAMPATRVGGRRQRGETLVTESHAEVAVRTGSRTASDDAAGAAIPSDWGALAQRAVDAATQAGAQYADARLTRTVLHMYSFGNDLWDEERTAISVRALVNGYWGFAAEPSADGAGAERLARAAVAQATVNARGALPRTVELAPTPVMRGTWSTPLTLDPFTIPLEEKFATMQYWERCAQKAGVQIDTLRSKLLFAREERVLATSEGTHLSQTVYESGGTIAIMGSNTGLMGVDSNTRVFVQGLDTAGRGWELFAKVPEQIDAMPAQLLAADALRKMAKPATIGRYTVVCDGATMAALLSATLGTATQLDRALGYEANANGTSFLDDPLGMLGSYQVASPLVTVTANRSAPTQLATVRWDDEGVIPPAVTLIKNGVLTDYQTTREQAAWLAPYYAKTQRFAGSHGHAAAETALGITMQHLPNLALEPSSGAVRLEDLVSNVQTGLVFQRGTVMQLDAQARSGILLSPTVREIKNGRLGRQLTDGVLYFNTTELWKNITALGGLATQMTVPFSQFPWGGAIGAARGEPVKGEPPQLTSHSVQAVAATLTNQALINPDRKA
jgi:TldD protein